MQERNDGTFGEITHGNDLLEQFIDNPFELARTRAIHFGTVEELEAVKEKRSIEDRLKSLENDVFKMKPTESEMILIPTRAQIKWFSKKFYKR